MGCSIDFLFGSPSTMTLLISGVVVFDMVIMGIIATLADIASSVP